MTIIKIALATTAALGLVTAASAQTGGMSSGAGKSGATAKSHRRSAHASTGYNQVSRKHKGAAGGSAMSGSGSGGSTTTMSNTSSGVMSH